jgi:hypothetical protein
VEEGPYTNRQTVTKKISLLFAVMLLLAASCAPNGTTGDFKWSLSFNETLTVGEEDAMPDYDSKSFWYTYRERVTFVQLA